MSISERAKRVPGSGFVLSLLSNGRLAGAAAVGYTVLLTNALLAPHPLWLFGEEGDWVAEVVARTFSDDVEHASAYAIFLCMWLWASRTRGWISPRMCVALTLGHGVIAEVLQYWIPQRFFDTHDLVANAVGCLLAGLVLRRLGMFQLAKRPGKQLPERFAPVGRSSRSIGVLPE